MPWDAPTYDYVIVGGGPAGCVLANRLTADPATHVLLIEAGTGNSSMARRLLARFTNWFDPALRWQYETVPQPGMNGRRMYLPQGRTLGGGSAINAMTYVRGQPADYEEWVRLGATGWDYETVLAAFKRIEKNAVLHDRYHGNDGLLSVIDQVHPHELTRVFVEAGLQVGLLYNRDFNGVSQAGIGTYQVTQTNGKRCSAADAFLGPVRHRSNLRVRTHGYVTRIWFEGRRASGVEFVAGGQIHRVTAEREVIVSGGAINSPKLLLLSGIGPADDLRRFGIPVIEDVPGVGKNLHDHLNVQVITRASRPITYDRWTSPARFVKYAAQFVLFNSGVATSNLCEGAAFLTSEPGLMSPDIQLHFMPLIWLDCGRAHVPGYGMTLETAFLQPLSRGTVTLAAADPVMPPLIDPAYCGCADDIRGLVRAIRRAREIMQAAAFRPFVAGELYPGPDKQSDAELADYARQSATTTYHPVGTCRMGVDNLAVVDPDLRVRGVENLRVIDSSIMPRIVSGSTQAPSGMIGEMGASLIMAAGR
ncbi:MAG TPA: GMC family oxidoreductase N-terminal domain-containing protein [Methylomirabilota bacterium]|nr:GMC family oxidoreductase N-terminal domain-containing protein [Methylomirabilota bacterium]